MIAMEKGLTDQQKKIEKVLLDTAIKLSANGIGSISVFNIGNMVKYDDLFEKDVEPFNIVEYPRRFEIVSGVDGACIINKEGRLISYSAMIKNAKPYRGFGTRHAASYTASLGGNIVIMTSEEDRKVRVFRDGALVMQIDPTEKEVKKKTSHAINLMESVGVGTLGVIGTSVLVPTLGLTLIPGIIFFGTAHNLGKFLFNTFLDNKSTNNKLK